MLGDHSSHIVKFGSGPLGVCGAIEAEARALLMGIRDLKKMDTLNCIVEGDSQTIISWG